jgi:hypothetical protein
MRLYLRSRVEEMEARFEQIERDMADPSAVPEVSLPWPSYLARRIYTNMRADKGWTQIKEPEKCDGWSWESWDDLKARKSGSEIGAILFQPLHRLLDQEPVLEALRPSA